MRWFLFQALMTIGCAISPNGPADSPDRPNIIIFMVDDLGWNHIGAQRGTMGTSRDVYRTPNIEKLSEEGLCFTHAYAQPNCAPTRAAMLTGQYPARVHNDVYVVGGLNRGKGKFRGPEQSRDVAPEAVTLAEALKKNGYATAHIGKYHVGGHRGRETLPENAGFDINIGGCSQGHQKTCFATKRNDSWDFRGVGVGHFNRFAAPYDEAYVARFGFPKELIGTPKHITDALTDALEETIRNLHGKTDPFFVQFHTYAVHGPVVSRPDLKDLAETYAGEDMDPEYLGFIRSVDLAVGRLMAALDDPDGDGDASDSIAGDTLVLFTSDNGGTHADNLPLKGKKGMFTEGGIRVPLIARWPGVVPAETVSDGLTHAVDYYPTCLELAGNGWLPSPEAHPLDGISFVEVMKNPGAKRKRGAIFYLFPGYLDVRAAPCVVAIDDIEGKRYKLSYFYESGSWELYCLTDDMAEERNLVESAPEIARILSGKMSEWLAQDHPTWRPKYPLDRDSATPLGPPPPF